MRNEEDFLGKIEIEDNSYTGIHTKRAVENFPVSGYKIDEDFIRAYGAVKLACAQTILETDGETEKQSAIIKACEEMFDGRLNKYIEVDALQGGAGTSLNMNVNEVIANRALEILGENKGEYEKISPLNDVNKYQSTNDTFPTALKIASLVKLQTLEKAVTALQEALQKKENEFRDIVKVGRTELTEAVLTTLGREFSAYAESISRDRWRIYKCQERLRVVNIGGTAIGTGLGAKKKFIFNVIENLRDITGLGLARAENLVESTQNEDVFAEVSGILKAHAVNLIKISNDLRLMSMLGEISMPATQAGSSIMPGKINPVICEMVAQIGVKIFGNDVTINQACSMGQLELNQSMPLIAFTFLESLNLLENANKIFAKKCILGIKANKTAITCNLNSSTATLTALLPKLGYEKLSEIAGIIQKTSINLKTYCVENKLMTDEEYSYLTSSEHILTLGD